MYNLFRNFWILGLEFYVRLSKFGLVRHTCSNRVFLMGHDCIVVVTWTSYFISSRKSVWAMNVLVQAYCLSLERWSEPSYLAAMYLVSPW